MKMESEKRREKFGIVKREEKALIFAVLFLAFVTVSIGCASAATIFVPDDYAEIQWAVDNATAGDTIIVRDGTYTENIDVKNPLTVRSENGSAYTFVTAANPDDSIFEIASNFVNVSGFTVEGSNLAGLYLILADYCNVSDNIASNNEYGFHLYKSSNNTIRNSFVSDNNRYGIFLDDFSSNNTVSNNTANGNYYYGIYLSEGKVTSNTITNNNASNNRYYGIYLHHSDSNTITNNNASDNGNDGIYLYYSDSNTITNNNASDNGNDGIYLHHSDSNTITNNNASDNGDDGIYLYYSGSNTITNNDASNNGDNGIYLKYHSYRNTISNNNASSNEDGFYLHESYRNTISNSTANLNKYHGIYLDFSNDNTILNSTALNNNWYGIYLDGSDDNFLSHNNASDNDRGICLGYSNDNIISNNTASNNEYGVYASHSSNGWIYLNNFISNTDNVYSWASTNAWNSTQIMNYSYKGKTYENYMGNYWDDYTGKDLNGDGIGDTGYSIDSDTDNYPLMQLYEDYFNNPKRQVETAVSTDKFLYAPCETMNITIGFKNPTEKYQPVIFAWGINFTDYNYFISLMTTPVTLPPEFDYSLTIPMHIGDWGSEEFNASWYVALANVTTYEIISEDTADWRYVPSEMTHGEIIPAEIGKEIKKTVEGVELPS